MSKNTKIEWADHTFNPWVGCAKVSPGCDNCYAESWAKRSGMVQWGPHSPRIRTSEANWKQPIKWNKQAQEEGIRYRVFCASLADVFDTAVPEQWRIDLFKLIEQTPNLDWLLLTKRIGNAADMLEKAIRGITHGREGWESNHFPNIWMGATIVNQEEADRDIPKLLGVLAAKRFLSIEPLLGAMSVFSEITGELLHTSGNDYNPGSIDWLIVGGESGHAARPMHHAWVTQLRDQCVAASIPFLFKQWGEFVSSHQHPDIQALYDRSTSGGWLGVDGQVSLGRDSHPRPGDEHIFKTGKKLAGRLLDGREWNDTPSTGVA
jgi:protein gp37